MGVSDAGGKNFDGSSDRMDNSSSKNKFSANSTTVFMVYDDV
jgi:hypothetical protein